MPNPFTLTHAELIAWSQAIFYSYRAGEAFVLLVEKGGEQYARPGLTQEDLRQRFEAGNAPTQAELRDYFNDTRPQ